MSYFKSLSIKELVLLAIFTNIDGYENMSMENY